MRFSFNEQHRIFLPSKQKRRTDLPFLARIVEAVIDAGAKVVNIPDTVGFITPGDLAPIATNNGQYAVIQEYNDAHPDKKLKLKASDTFAIDIVQWVNEGRADGGVMMEGAFNSQVVDKGSPYGKHFFIQSLF